jgi:sulfite exporter TauE/SafE/copper chaperone CopZ
MKNRKKVFVEGMHCASCEILISNDLRKIDTIKTHKVSHKKGFVEVSYESDQDLQKITVAILENGYKVTSQPQKKAPSTHKNSFKDYTQMVAIFAGFMVAASILKELNIYQYIPSLGEDLTVAVAFLLGLIASVSTCLALVGGIVISFGSAYDLEGNKQKLSTYIKPHLFFHIGRLGAFIILGGLLGAIGSALEFSISLTSYLTLAVAIIMLYIGLQILNITPSITRLGFHLPKELSSKIHTLQEAEHATAPFVIGALTFFLPCGFTQSAQLAAVATGSFTNGALIMGAFALGTLPVLLALGVSSSYSQKLKLNLLKKIIGVLIILFAIFSLNNSMRLLGVNLDLPTEENTQEVVITEDGFQEVHMTVDWGFEPNSFTIKKDIPVRWIIEGKNISGCISEIIIPTLNKNFVLEKGENVFEFTPTETGTLNFSCWMGMVGGKFTVTE